MSTTIDERVVQFELENDSFEQKAKETEKTLAELEKALQLKTGSKGLEKIEAAAEKTDFESLVKAADTVSNRLSIMGMVGVNALTNITNKAIDSGERLVKSLSIDQVTAGYSKYEKKTQAIQTIMNATGLGIEQVNSELEKLNWFTDETSYNFIDMVSNIGKFTSQQIPLDESVTAMQGIATWAAKAGQGTNEASRAMYNLSQAMGVGAVKLMDWKSIQNANMATAEFKELAIQVAESMGAIQNGEVTIQNFDNTLSKGWFTKDVLMDVLSTYGSYADKVYDYIETVKIAEGRTLTCAEAMEEMGDMGLKLGASAFRAAQEAKTFTEAIDATKDAVSTGWMQTFEIIFGSYDEAKRLWTDLANGLWEIFAGGGVSRNEMLIDAFGSKWDSITERIESAGMDMKDFNQELYTLTARSGVYVDGLEQTYGDLETALKNGALSGEYLKRTIEKIAKSESEAAQGTVNWSGKLKEYNKIAKEFQNGEYGVGYMARKNLEEAGYNFELISAIAEKSSGRLGVSFNELREIMVSLGLGEGDVTAETLRQAEAWRKLAEDARTVGSDLEYAIDNVGRASGRELIRSVINNTLDSIINFKDTASDVWGEVFDERSSESIYRFVNRLSDLSEMLLNTSESAEGLRKTLNLTFSGIKVITKGIGVVTSSLGLGVRVIGGVLKDFSSQIGFLQRVVDGVETRGITGLEDLSDRLEALSDKINNISYEDVKSAISELIRRFIDFATVSDTIKKRVEGLRASIKILGSKVSPYVSPVTKAFNKVKEAVSPLFSEIKTNFSSFGNFVSTTIIEPLSSFVKILLKSEDPVGTFLEGLGKIGTFANTVRKDFKTFLGGLDLTELNSIKDQVITPLIDSFAKFKTAIGEFIDSLSMMDMLKIFAGGMLLYNITLVSEAIGKVGNLATAAKGSFDNLNKFLKGKLLANFTNNFKAIANSIVEVTAAIVILASVPVNDLWRATSALIGITAVIGVIAFALSKVSSNMTIDAVANLQAMTAAVMAIGVAMIFMSGAYTILSKADAGNIGTALSAMVGIASVLVVTCAVLGKYGTALKASTVSILGIAASIFILSIGLNKLTNIKITHPENIMVLSAVLLALAKVSAVTTKFKAANIAVGILSLVASVILIITALDKIKTFSLEGLGSKIAEIAVICGSLITALLVIGTAGKLAKGIGKEIVALSAGVTLIIGAMFLLSVLLERISKMEGDTQAAAGTMMELSLTMLIIGAALGAALGLSGGAKGFIAASAGIMTAVVSLYTLANLMQSFNKFTWKKDWAPVTMILSLAGILGAMSIAMGFAAKLGGVTGIFYMIFAVSAIVVLGDAFKALQGIPWDSLWPIMLAISVTLGAVGGMFMLLGTAVKVAGKNEKPLGTMLGMIGIVAAIGAALYFAAQNDWTSLAAAAVGISVTILALVGAFAILGALMRAVPIILDGVLILTGAIALMSASALALAYACTVLDGCNLSHVAEGLLALGGTAGPLALLGVAFLSLGVGLLAASVGLGALGAVGAMSSGGILLVNEALTALALTIATIGSAIGGKLGETFSTLKNDLLENNSIVAEIASALGNKTTAAQVEGLEAGTGDVVAAVENQQEEIGAAIETSGENSRKAARKLGQEIVEAQAEGIEEAAKERPAMSLFSNFGGAFGTFDIGNFLGDINIEDISGKIKEAFSSMFGGIDLSAIAGENGFSLSSIFSGGFKEEDVASVQEKLTEFTQASFSGVDLSSQGKETGDNYTQSLTKSLESQENKRSVKEAGKTLGNEAVEGAKSVDAAPSGANFIDGFVRGIQNNAWKIKNAVQAAAQAAATTLNISLQIHSPSRVAANSGRYFDEGFAKGITDNTGSVIKAVARFAANASSAFNAALQNESSDDVIVPVFEMGDIYDQLGDYENAEWNPVIRPVLDMSALDTGLNNTSAIIRTRYPNVGDTDNVDISDSNVAGRVTFNQYNYSPKALDRIEIYRQTKNLISTAKGG